MAEDFLRKVYDLESQEETNSYYSAWAATYDEEVTRQGYRTPQRCAEALARFVGLDQPILDIGCGTGISGAALRNAGFTRISGTDVNPEMLELAQRSEIYDRTWVTDLGNAFPFEPGTYAALAAIGVIGLGAAPVSVLIDALDALAPSGHLVFSYNEHVLALPEFTDALVDAEESGVATQVFSELGHHFESLGTTSNVYVMSRQDS